MKKIFFTVSLAWCAGMVLTVFLSPAAAQVRDVEEQRYRLDQPEVPLVKDGAPGERKQRHSDHEIRFVAGKDKLWFTQDDEVCHYYLKEVDDNGRVVKRSYIKPGKDNISLTADDELQDYQVFSYRPDGRVKREVSYDGEKHKQYTAEYIYDALGKKTDVRRFDPRGREIRHMTYIYNVQGQVVQDEEYVNDKLEKYHRFEYDDKGRIKRAVEYHSEKNGAGADGKWFTPDDVVSSAKEYFYDADGDQCKDKKYIGAGPDGKWFTDDDEIQYYTLSEY
jgi:hypothetical protein